MNTMHVSTPAPVSSAVSLGMPRLRRTEPRAGLRVPTAPLGLPARPDVPELVDRFGRTARDLRVSLTDRCNLRCRYCMPAEGIDPLPGQDILTDDEVIRLVRIAAHRLGIRELRLTGGEPLLRKGLEKIVAASSALTTQDGQRLDVSLTTNALGLARRAAGLKEAGLSRVNISLDAADRETYAKLTRRDRYEDALAGARASAAVGLSPIKVNAVLMPGINDHQAGHMLFQALTSGYRLRFIEHMPLGPRGAWTREGMITADDILAALASDFRLVATGAGQRGASPAEEWRVLPGKFRGREHPGGTVGVIASMTRPFCGDCDRTRLTADGQIRACLFSAEETDLRGLMRAGASDEEIADAWRLAMWGKQAGHGTNEPGFRQPDRPMSAIGG
ncbi:MAG: GTP 3',8-cyclase MoaA [Actinomycetaceae bacterium]|nr:GTP 3',8-cyclase MoaA [Actinomycetaceae bacterium]